MDPGGAHLGRQRGVLEAAQAYRANQRELDHDLGGAYEISLYGGHWQGQGEPFGGERGPGGNLIDLRGAIKRYFQVPFNLTSPCAGAPSTARASSA